MAEDPIKQSRRAIDLYTADQFGRIDEKLKTMTAVVEDLKQEVFGGHGQPGLGEQVRGIVKTWGSVIAIATTLVSWVPWLYDHFIAKNKAVAGEEWVKNSSKRVRLYDKDSKQWVTYYAIEEQKPDQ